MKIADIHVSDPSTRKVFDTVRAYRNNYGLLRHLTQTEFDRHELDSFENNKRMGYVLFYEVLFV